MVTATSWNVEPVLIAGTGFGAIVMVGFWTGVTMGSYLLSTFGYEVESTQQELEDFGVDVARETLDIEQIARWFEDHAAPV